MDCLVETIFSQDSPKEESDESQYVEECLKLSAVIIVKNINLQLLEDGSLESTSTVLTKLFSDDNKYYQENEGRRTRYKVINTFHVQGGFSSLVEYIASRQLATSSRAIEFLELVVRTVYELAVAKDTHGAPEEPVKPDRGVTSTDIRALTILGTLPLSSSDFEASLSSSPRLQAAEPAIVESIVSMPDFSASRDSRKKDAVCVTNAIVVGFIRHISFQQLRVESLETLKALLDKLEFILMGTRSVQSTQEDMEEYANVIRGLVLQTITSNRVELKDFGWDRIRDLVYVAERYRLPTVPSPLWASLQTFVLLFSKREGLWKESEGMCISTLSNEKAAMAISGSLFPADTDQSTGIISQNQQVIQSLPVTAGVTWTQTGRARCRLCAASALQPPLEKRPTL